MLTSGLRCPAYLRLLRRRLPGLALLLGVAGRPTVCCRRSAATLARWTRSSDTRVPRTSYPCLPTWLAGGPPRFFVVSLARATGLGKTKPHPPPPRANVLTFCRLQFPSLHAPLAHCEAFVTATSWVARRRSIPPRILSLALPSGEPHDLHPVSSMPCWPRAVLSDVCRRSLGEQLRRGRHVGYAARALASAASGNLTDACPRPRLE